MDRCTGAATWSPAIEKLFLEELAVSANVARSARAAGTTDKRAWQKRGRDAKFRAAFVQALAEGYLRLEVRMLQRALERAGGARTGRNAPSQAEERTWLQLLRQHRAAVQPAGTAGGTEDLAVVTQRIDGKLAEMKRRLEAAAGTAG